MNRSYIRQAQPWPTIRLGDIAQFSNGVNFDKSSYSSEGIRLIGVSNFADRLYPEFDDLSCIQPDAITENDLLAEQDIIFVRSNGNKELVGRSMFVKTLPDRTTYSGFCIRARMKDTTKVYPLFYAYYFKSLLFRRSISGVSRGSNIQNLNQGILKSCNVPYPPLAEQRRIADILSAYDDLIENNRKQIKLLEEAAQRLYKEWFIDLHFPGYEHTKIINGIPEGWKKEFLTDIADIQYGYAFDGSLFNDKAKGTPIIRIRNIPMGVTNDYTTEEANNQYLVNNGEIVVGMDGEFHINTWGGETAYLVQRTCCIRPKKEIQKGYLLLAIHDPIKFFEKTVVGSTVAHLGKKHLDTIMILMPPGKFIIMFHSFFEKRQLLINKITKLISARDHLLPKLMNGKIEVREK